MYDSKWKSALRRKLLKWYDENRRDLPWRKNSTPYRIWVSEIMLQQTQVVTVVDYYKRFIKRFPGVAALAGSSESEVLKLWEGLGYYRRARQLHAAAQKVVTDHGGEFPTTFDEVLELPGIGRYTAGAILSISLDQRLPILEGNTIRLFARLMEMKSDPRSRENQNALWEFSESMLPRKRCGDFNQALMELGSEICHPKNPKCLICPLRGECPTAVKGLQESIPAPGRKLKYEKVKEAVVIVERRNKFLVRKCAPGERWAGLWDFPRWKVTSNDPPAELAEKLHEQTGLGVELKSTVTQIKHAVTRYRIVLDCFRAVNVSGRLVKRTGLQWMSLEQIEEAPMSVTGRKIAKSLAFDAN